jgi:preprotein translocase subunit SecE
VREWIDKAIRFFKEVRVELGKVSWPQRNQVIGSTAVVIVSVFLLSFFLGLVDILLQKVMSAIFG